MKSLNQSNGVIGQWYDAEAVAIICDLYMEADELGILVSSQQHILKKAKILLRSLAKVGITALIDEATNYQDSRDKDELQQLLEKFIAEELRPYSKEFRSEYFEELFHLYGLPYDPTTTKRPQYFAKFTKKYVYEMLPPNVWDELDKQNPLVFKEGTRVPKRKYHIHRQLSEKGLVFLKEHLESLISVMKLSDDIKDFRIKFSRVYEKKLRKLEKMKSEYQISLFKDYE